MVGGEAVPLALKVATSGDVCSENFSFFGADPWVLSQVSVAHGTCWTGLGTGDEQTKDLPLPHFFWCIYTNNPSLGCLGFVGREQRIL